MGDMKAHKHTASTGYQPGCDGCKAERKIANDKHRALPGVREADRRKAWVRQGMNADDAEAAWLESGGVCAICKRSDRRLHVDHDHATGAVRSVLCSTCNQALGLLQDDPTRLRAAAAYLETHAVRQRDASRLHSAPSGADT